MILNQWLYPAVTVGLLIWVIILTIYVLRHKGKTVGLESEEELKQLLDSLEADLQSLEEFSSDNRRAIEWLKLDGVRHVQKIGLIRFNPFDDTGGDQSFAMVLLDGDNNGIVLSSLHSRTGQRIYAKSITRGVAEEHELSDEEQEALSRAVKKK